MTRRTPFALTLSLFVLFLCLPLAASRAQEPLATLRIESLDGAMMDVQQVADALGFPLDQEQVTGQALSPFGLSDEGWLDRSRPILVTMPMQGMMLGLKGMVGAFPVKDSAAAITALKGIFDLHDLSGDVHTFTNEDGNALAVQAQEGYLVGSANASLLRGFDLQAALAGGELPPGSLALEVQLGPLAPVLQAGIEQGRQMIKTQIALEAEQESGAEIEITLDGQGELEDQESAEPEIDPQQLAAMLDLYFDLLLDITRNVNRLQISAEVSGDHVIFHKRLLPTPGSTLAGLIEAQQGGFPEIARLLPFEGDFVSVVANMRYTPDFVAAVKVYFSAYIDSMSQLMQSADADPFMQQLAPMMKALEPLIDLWFECQRGDFAGSFALDAERGLRVVEILGAADPDACRSVLAQSAQLYAGLEPGPDGQRLFSVTENALVHSGVQADRYETRMDLAFAASPTDDPEREEALQLLHSLFGSDALTTFSGLSGDLMLITGGAESEQAFKDLVDVSKKKKKKKKLEGGLTPEAFAPLEAGPGLFVSMDLAALAGTVAASMAPLADDENEELERLKEFPDDAGNLVYGARLDSGSFTIELAMPLKLIRAIREMIPDDESAEVEPEVETTGA